MRIHDADNPTAMQAAQIMSGELPIVAELRADVLRLRARDEAWEWLTKGCWRLEMGDDRLVAYGSAANFNDVGEQTPDCEYEIGDASHVDGKPDPVALATALGWKGEMV